MAKCMSGGSTNDLQRKETIVTAGLNAYLFFDGQCEAALSCYEQALGGRIVAMGRHADAPPEVPPIVAMQAKGIAN
jgi:hypothetical protein